MLGRAHGVERVGVVLQQARGGTRIEGQRIICGAWLAAQRDEMTGDLADDLRIGDLAIAYRVVEVFERLS